MSDAIQLLSLPVILAAGTLLGRKWPVVMRRFTRTFCAIIGGTLCGIIATGFGPHSGPTGLVHRWLPHALFILAWWVVPFSVGVIASRPRRPLAFAAFCLVPLALLGVIFLASVTGYLGPSRGQVDALALRRFRVLHYGVWPSLAIALATVWYHGLGPGRDARTPGPAELPADAS